MKPDDDPPQLYPGSVDFRAHRSAAPLKRERFDALLKETTHFRAHRSAAPLKLAAVVDDFDRRREFPRSSERGPIEAATAVLIAHTPRLISALIGARPH